MGDGPLIVLLIAGALAFLLALLAMGLRAAHLYEGPGVSLAATALSAMTLLIAIAATVVARRALELELSALTSTLEQEWQRNVRFVGGGLVSVARQAALPGLLLGALGFSRSTRKGSSAGGWLLISLTALLWIGGLAFEWRKPPAARYPPEHTATWKLAIALETNSCPALEDALDTADRRATWKTIPPELDWRGLAEACVLERIESLEGRPLDGDWLRQRQALESSLMLVDESLRLRVIHLTAGPARWSGQAIDTSAWAKRKVAERLLLWRPGFASCFAAAPGAAPVTIAFVPNDLLVDELRVTTPDADPALARCLMEVLAHVTLDSLPRAAEFTFAP